MSFAVICECFNNLFVLRDMDIRMEETMLYIIRHGQTKANANNQYLGATDSPLTEKGEKQHRHVIEQLNSINIHTVYSSPRERCVALANQLTNKSIHIDERIAEINFGVFEQLTWQQAQVEYPDVWNEWIKNDATYQIPNGESQQQVQQRVKLFVKEIISIAEQHDIAIVTHGGIITLMLCYLFNFETKHQWNFKINNGSIIKINGSDGFAYMEI